MIERLIDLDYLKRLSADYPILTLTDEFDAFFHDKRAAVMKMRAEKKKTTGSSKKWSRREFRRARARSCTKS